MMPTGRSAASCSPFPVLLMGLTQQLLRDLVHRGRTLQEFDLDEAWLRQPTVPLEKAFDVWAAGTGAVCVCVCVCVCALP